MPKEIIFSDDVRKKIAAGVKKLSDAVRVTLGPTGRVVMIERDFGYPFVTKDGVTVAKEVDLPDRIENMGAQMVKQVTAKTSTVAGDGTTTATIYADAIFSAGIKNITFGAKPQEVKRGIDKAVDAIIKELSRLSRPIVDIEEISQVAKCSANQDTTIGTMIADAMNKVGQDGVITIEEGRTMETFVNVVDGMQFNKGYLSPHFATNKETGICEFESPLILITDHNIVNTKSILSLLDKILKDTRPLVIIAENIDGDALATLIVNNLKGNIKVVAISAPGFGDRRQDTLNDIAIVTGSRFISKDLGSKLEDVKMSDLGTCEKLVADRDATTIVKGGGKSEDVDSRIQLIRTSLESTVTDFDREKLQERLARLAGGIAQIVVGGATEVEVREKRDRIEDALHACRAAVEEGILPGGGVAAIYASRTVLDNIKCATEDERMGVEIVRRALQAPLRQIAVNTGIDDGEIVSKIMDHPLDDFGYGFDAAVGEYCNLVERGVIVPTKVERVALQNAASVSGLLLTTDCMISNIPEVTAPDESTPFGMPRM